MKVYEQGVQSRQVTTFSLGTTGLIQQINRLLEPLILDECCVSLFRCLDRSMTKQMLDVCNRGTFTQQASGKRPSQIVRGHIGNTGSIECGFQCSIILYRFVATKSAREYVQTSPPPKKSSVRI
jgi:hypothetical protein